MFRNKFPLAWLYHRNTSRWPYNIHTASTDARRSAPFKEYPLAATIPLPTPVLPTISFADAVALRASCRQFTGEPLPLMQLSNLLYAGYGIQGEILLDGQQFFERTVPSGGGLFPLELYIIMRYCDEIDPGIYHYNALHHLLEQIHSFQLPGSLLSDLFLGQRYLMSAASIVVITAVLERSLWKYEERGYRYILFEAGHVAQNLNLAAAAMEIGSLNLGGFFDTQLATMLGLDIELEIPLYCTAFGIPTTKDRVAMRMEY
jgi:SagB-type dehydrogenase family enzyme